MLSALFRSTLYGMESQSVRQRWPWGVLVFGAIAALGCIGQSGTEVSKSEPACRDVRSVPIGADDMTALGTPREVAARLPQRERAELSLREFPRPGAGAATHSVPETSEHPADDGSTTYTTQVTLVWMADASQARSVETTCGRPALDLAATLRFESDDDLLRATFAGTLRVADALHFSGSVPVSDIEGRFDVSVAASHYLEPKLNVHAFLDRHAGSLDVFGRDPKPREGETLVSASVGSWSAVSPFPASTDN